MAENMQYTVQELAADKSRFLVWDPDVEFPTPETMRDVEIITQVEIERAVEGEWHYLHEAAITWHKGLFYSAWANGRLFENLNHDEVIRGKTSVDGLRWSEIKVWAEAPLLGATSFNCPLLFSTGDKLYGFFVAWYGEEHEPTTEIFVFNEETETFEHQPGCGIKWFVPFGRPQKLPDGNWLISGENYWYQSAVLISHGDDFLHWDMVTIPKPEEKKEGAFTLLFPESATYQDGDRLVNFGRPDSHFQPYVAPVAVSYDNGRTWSEMELSNFGHARSQPCAGTLSNGRNFLITNGMERGRVLLTIALTEPGGGLFKYIYKVRHCPYPTMRLFGGYTPTDDYKGHETEWGYPKTCEHDGNLYIIYSQGKEDCAMSIIPVECLKGY